MVELTNLAAVGAGLAIMGGAIGTGLAQREVLAAALGAVIEDPKNLGKAILFVALPETILFISMVIAIVILMGILGGGA